MYCNEDELMSALYADRPLKDYLSDAASGAPTPGGGSVSALAAALGVSMASMAANFTVGKKKFAAVDEQCRDILDDCESARTQLLELADEDTQAYAEVSKAYGLPRSTPEEKTARAEGIQKALHIAMDVPLRTFRVCARLCGRLQDLAEIANPNLISDVGVAAIIILAGLEGSKLNVEINLKYLKDEAFVSKIRGEINAARAAARRAATSVFDSVRKQIGATDV